tara:strand:- start:313 stop:567 length:255 start_codon:yes stop_codon:yes gene_type:complete
MIISIKNDEGITSYDVNKIENEGLQNNARITINKVGQLEVLLEALNFASSAHRGNLESLLKDTPEAVVESEEETVDEEASSEED